jgi:predicted GNAT family acetyltransferase
MTGPGTDVVVADAPHDRRYEARIGGELVGLVDYRSDADAVILTHAEVFPQWEGHGVGTALARATLDDIVGQGKRIGPACPFIRDFMRDHPEYVADVVESYRHLFR